jgi:hypothetical protein
MVGDYPTEGWRFWVFLLGVTLLGAIGLIVMLAVKGV